MYDTTNSEPTVADRVNAPSISVIVALVVPLIETLAPIIVSPLLSATIP